MQGTETPLQRKASEAFACFETAFRDPQDDSSSFVRLRNGSPDWVTDLVQHAHGDMLPDDYRYAWTMNALECLSDCDDPEDAAHEWAAGAVDVYTSELLAWVGSHSSRIGFCDSAMAERDDIYPDGGVAEVLAMGQYDEMREVFELVWRWLEDSLES